MARLLVLGTHNRKKLSELQGLLGGLAITLRTLVDFPQAIVVDETGRTFRENAALKASQQAKHLGAWVLGEDSGLSVDALCGAPGVYSARYSGPNASDETNNLLLLKNLVDIPSSMRTAHYTCHAALSDPAGNIVARVEDTCEGRIRQTPTGSGGFGYDPLFEVEEFALTFGELSTEIKNRVSHRAKAIRALRLQIEQLIQSNRWSE